MASATARGRNILRKVGLLLLHMSMLMILNMCIRGWVHVVVSLAFLEGHFKGVWL